AALADRAGGFARALEIVQLDDGRAARRDEAALELLQVELELRVVQLLVRALLEMDGCQLHERQGSSPARTSATCSTRVRESPRRRRRPSMFIMQPRSPSTTASAPEFAMCAHLLSARRVAISPYFTENVPPKPQHVSHSAISTTSTPAFASSARGWLLTFISRRPLQLS